MSVYVVNKFMRAVEMRDDAVAAYVRDPRAYVEEWMASSSTSAQWADDRSLTADEQRAFAERDYAGLYRLGGHPYLLWHFTEAVYIHEVEWPRLVERYRRAIADLPAPDLAV